MPAASVHTATYEPGQARVRLNLSGFAAATTSVQITRTNTVTGRVELVRGARAIPITTPASDTVQVYDYEYPAGQTVEYAYFQSPDATRYQLAAPAAYDVVTAWWKHVLRPYLNRQIVIVDYTPYDHGQRVTANPVVRRNLPVAGGDVRGGRSYGLTVRAADADQRGDLDDLLAVGGVYFMHLPGGNDSVPDPGYVMATDAKEVRVGKARGPVRYFQLSLVEVAAPDADLAGSGITWNDVVATYATWNDVVAAVATWNDLVAQVATPAEVIVP